MKVDPVRQVQLVNEADEPVGTMEILTAHQRPGRLHRAVSVLLFKKVANDWSVLLQQRSEYKPLWPLFWSNTVCGNLWAGEDYLECGLRRLEQELGIKLRPDELQMAYKFQYQADYNQELSEHEIDQVLVGRYDGPISINPQEVKNYAWESWQKLKQTAATNEQFTPWFKLIVTNLEWPGES